jgi:hypothetical protein
VQAPLIGVTKVDFVLTSLFVTLSEYVSKLRQHRPGATPPVVYVQYDRTGSEVWNGYGVMFAALMVELELAKGVYERLFRRSTVFSLTN